MVVKMVYILHGMTMDKKGQKNFIKMDYLMDYPLYGILMDKLVKRLNGRMEILVREKIGFMMEMK